jgi:hypothetical protein
VASLVLLNSIELVRIFLQSKIVILASYLQSGGPGLCIYVPQQKAKGWHSYNPVILFPFSRLLQLAGLSLIYSNPSQNGINGYLPNRNVLQIMQIQSIPKHEHVYEVDIILQDVILQGETFRLPKRIRSPALSD